jgi:hypothetical protein
MRISVAKRRGAVTLFLVVVFGGLTLLIWHHIEQFKIHAATCFTVAEVQADARCLYIFHDQVYEKGTRAAPHHANACGSDVTAIIPSFHYNDMVRYLDPNYQGDICSVVPTIAPTLPVASPTIAPTLPPSCATKAQGDANCDGRISLTDFEIWREEYTGTVATHTADFTTNGTTPPDLADFEVWRLQFTL